MGNFQWSDVLSLKNCWENVFPSPGTFSEIVHPISLFQLDGKNFKRLFKFSCSFCIGYTHFTKDRKLETGNLVLSWKPGPWPQDSKALVSRRSEIKQDNVYAAHTELGTLSLSPRSRNDSSTFFSSPPLTFFRQQKPFLALFSFSCLGWNAPSHWLEINFHNPLLWKMLTCGA